MLKCRVDLKVTGLFKVGVANEFQLDSQTDWQWLERVL